MHGQRVTRAEIDGALGTTPAIRAQLARARTLDSLGFGLMFAGLPTIWGGVVATVATKAWPVVAVPLAGVAMLTSGLVVMITYDDPFRVEVHRYNEEAVRKGLCQSPAEEWTPGGSVWIPPEIRSPPPRPEDGYAPPVFGPPPLAP